MKIGVLEAGAPPKDLLHLKGSYGDMFRRLLAPDLQVRIYDVQAGSLPIAESEEDAYVITGSSSGVYDREPWIDLLEAFLQRTAGLRPLLGICFGHQILAQALSGAVVKSPKGWGIGLHRYQVKARAPWMDPIDSFALPASHQDQVVAIGPKARVLASSSFTPFAMIDYPELRALSLQAHPEFEPEFAQALLQRRRGSVIPTAEADAAVATLAQPNDRDRVAGWLKAFLQGG